MRLVGHGRLHRKRTALLLPHPHPQRSHRWLQDPGQRRHRWDCASWNPRLRTAEPSLAPACRTVQRDDRRRSKHARHELHSRQLGYQIDNTVMTAEYTYIELGYGDASNKHVILRLLHGATATGAGAEGIGEIMDAHLIEGYWRVPAGSNLYVRGRCNNAPDTGYNADAVGIGG